ncbi:hypothetical protein L0990_09605 [Vibrio kanaloae]|uniref:hypothetical protein n=1 Tax=Vibrio kanaloae TaxID=170673 RepID=UPI0035A665B6
MSKPSNQQEVKKTCKAGGCRKVVKGKAEYCSKPCRQKSSAKSKAKVKSKSKTKAKLTCSNCPNPISYGNKSGLCKDCKNLERIAYRKANLHLCSISEWLIRKVIRHGTVECLPRDKQGMQEILYLRIFYYQANGFQFDEDWSIDLDARRFEVCHRFPCKHSDGRIGLFVRDNLVIAPKALNRSMGNRVVCENGLWLDPANLDPTFKTYKGMSNETIFNLIADWCPYLVEHLMQKTDKGAYRFSLSRNRSKPKKQPKDIEGMTDREVYQSESYQSFGFEDMTPFSGKVNYLDFELDFDMSYLDLGFEYLLTTPALPKSARKANTKTPSDFDYAPLLTEEEFEDTIPF